jgi:hypothetical protein
LSVAFELIEIRPGALERGCPNEAKVVLQPLERLCSVPAERV